MTGSLPLNLFYGWLATGARGISSEAIVSHLTGVPISGRLGLREPCDPSDFRRCELLLRAVPLARLALPAMRTVSPIWGQLVDHWDELVDLIEEEAPGTFTA